MRAQQRVLCLALAVFLADFHEVDSSHSQGVDDISCPTWTRRKNGSATECECGDDMGGRVLCDPKSKNVYILKCFCISYDESRQRSIFGPCFYNCYPEKRNENNSSGEELVIRKTNLYYRLNRNKTDLDESCRHLNRKGNLCGDCIEEHAPPLFSYEIKCIKCSGVDFSYAYVYAKIILLVFLPQTIFFFVALACRISTTTPKLNAFLIVSQIIGSRQFIKMLVQTIEDDNFVMSAGVKQLCYVLISIYSLWNLDFFIVYNKSICIPNLDTMDALKLEVLPALYPLLLTFLTFVTIELHARGWKIITILCSPVSWIFGRFRRGMDIRNSIIDVFATFLIFSYVKIIYSSVDILTPIAVKDLDNKILRFRPYHQASSLELNTIKILTGIISILAFVICPLLLLLLYPLRCFRKCLDKLCYRAVGARFALKVFMDSFQGCFKDKTELGAHDYRYMGGLYLMVRLLIYLVFIVTLYVDSAELMVIIFIAMALLVLVTRPYKTKYAAYNIIDPLFFGYLAIFLTVSSLVAVTNIRHKKAVPFYIHLTFVLGLIPPLYLVIITIRFIINSKLILRLRERVKCSTNDTTDEEIGIIANMNRDMATYSSLD